MSAKRACELIKLVSRNGPMTVKQVLMSVEYDDGSVRRALADIADAGIFVEGKVPKVPGVQGHPPKTYALSKDWA